MMIWFSQRIGFSLTRTKDTGPAYSRPSGRLVITQRELQSQMEIRSHKTPAFPDCHGVTLIDFKKNYFNVRPISCPFLETIFTTCDPL